MLLKGIMAARGIDARKLAKMAKLHVSVVRNISCGNNRCRGAREKIEMALERPLWTEDNEFYARLRKHLADRPAELVELKIAVLRAPYTHEGLAKLAGISPQVLARVIACVEQEPEPYLAIERVLGRPIITPPEKFYAEMRQRAGATT